MDYLLRVNNISLIQNERTILSNICLDISPKQIVTLIGPNGAGKTSLVRLILGLTPTSHGQIEKNPNLRIGYMPQKMHIEAMLPMRVERFLKLVPNCDPHQIDHVLTRVGAQHVKKSFLHTLSGGEFQRVLLARALLQKPDLLVLDEPVQGVDVRGQTELYNLIKQVRDEDGCAILMVSHDLHWVMAATDVVVCLNQHVCCQGHPQHVTSNPEYVNLFGANSLALYTHHHDHHHDLHGNVVDGCTHEHAHD